MTAHETYIREAVPEDLPRLTTLAESDEHTVVVPTHVVENGQGLVGYSSVGAVPMVVLYLHTKKAKARDSYRLEQHAEALAKRMGCPFLCVPCAVHSPLHRYMEKLGFKSFGTMDMYIKQLT